MKPLHAALRMLAQLASPGGKQGRLSILTYHRVLSQWDPLLSAEQVDARLFEAHMQALADCFQVLPLREAIQRLEEGSLPKRAVAITFDDGYADNCTEALPVLRRMGLPATFFICSGFLGNGLMFNDIIAESIRLCTHTHVDLRPWGLGLVSLDGDETRRTLTYQLVRYVKHLSDRERSRCCLDWHELLTSGEPLPSLMMNEDQIRLLAACGMGVEAHTHRHPILSRISLSAAREDIQHNIDAITHLTGKRPTLFAYPNGRPGEDFDASHVALLKEMGFEAAVTTAWGVANRHSDPFQLPRFAPWDHQPHHLVARLIKQSALNRPVLHIQTPRPPPIQARALIPP